MNGRRARVGVVGSGWWSTRVHLPAIAEHERAELVGIVDTDSERAALAAATFGATMSSTSIDELFDAGVDVVVIATPHHTHFELADRALRAGVDVLVEKPMVLDPLEALSLVDLADRSGRRLHVGYPYPHGQLPRRLRAAIANGDMGDLQLVTSVFATPAGVLYVDGDRWPASDAIVGPDPSTWNRTEVGGGQAYGQLTHAISLALFCTGLHVAEVSARVAAFGRPVDLVDTAAFSTTAGAIGTIATSGGVGMGLPTLETLAVFGSEGHAVYDMGAGTLAVATASGVATDGPLTGEDRYPERAPARALIDDFLDEAVPLVDGRLGLGAVAFVDGVLRSAATGQPVDVTLDDAAPRVEEARR